MDPSAPSPHQSRPVQDIRYFFHNRAEYLVVKVGERDFIDCTRADLDVLISIRGIYREGILYYLSNEQIEVLVGIRDSLSFERR